MAEPFEVEEESKERDSPHFSPQRATPENSINLFPKPLMLDDCTQTDTNLELFYNSP